MATANLGDAADCDQFNNREWIRARGPDVQGPGGHIKESPFLGEEDRSVNVDDEGPEKMASWQGQPAVKGSTESMRMALLTFSLVGIQFVLPVLLAMGTKLTLWQQVYLGN